MRKIFYDEDLGWIKSSKADFSDLDGRHLTVAQWERERAVKRWHEQCVRFRVHPEIYLGSALPCYEQFTMDAAMVESVINWRSSAKAESGT